MNIEFLTPVLSQLLMWNGFKSWSYTNSAETSRLQTMSLCCRKKVDQSCAWLAPTATETSTSTSLIGPTHLLGIGYPLLRPPISGGTPSSISVLRYFRWLCNSVGLTLCVRNGLLNAQWSTEANMIGLGTHSGRMPALIWKEQLWLKHTFRKFYNIWLDTPCSDGANHKAPQLSPSNVFDK